MHWYDIGSFDPFHANFVPSPPCLSPTPLPSPPLSLLPFLVFCFWWSWNPFFYWIWWNRLLDTLKKSLLFNNRWAVGCQFLSLNPCCIYRKLDLGDWYTMPGFIYDFLFLFHCIGSSILDYIFSLEILFPFFFFPDKKRVGFAPFPEVLKINNVNI